MNLPQGADLDLGLETELPLDHDGDAWPDTLAGHRHPDAEANADASDIVWHPEDDGLLDAPVLIGWELVTVEPAELAAAVLTLPTRPWQLALVSFADRTDADGHVVRQVAAAAADGRLIGADLRLGSDDCPEVLRANVSRDADDLGTVGALAASLRAALRSAARGIG